MLIIPYVCADFRDKKGNPIFRITAEGVRRTILMVVRIMLLVSCTFLLTYTTSPLQLTDGLEQLLSPLKKLKRSAKSFVEALARTRRAGIVPRRRTG